MCPQARWSAAGFPPDSKMATHLPLPSRSGRTAPARLQHGSSRGQAHFFPPDTPRTHSQDGFSRKATRRVAVRPLAQKPSRAPTLSRPIPTPPVVSAFCPEGRPFPPIAACSLSLSPHPPASSWPLRGSGGDQRGCPRPLPRREPMGSARGGRVRASPPSCESITRSRWVGSCYSGASTPSPTGLLCVPWTGKSHRAPHPPFSSRSGPTFVPARTSPSVTRAGARAGPLVRVARAGPGLPGRMGRALAARPVCGSPLGVLPAPARRALSSCCPAPSPRPPARARPRCSASDPPRRRAALLASRPPCAHASPPGARMSLSTSRPAPRALAPCVAGSGARARPRRGRAPFPPRGLCPGPGGVPGSGARVARVSSPPARCRRAAARHSRRVWEVIRCCVAGSVSKPTSVLGLGETGTRKDLARGAVGGCRLR